MNFRAPKPLALNSDDILTNSGAWKVNGNALEKVTLNLKLNDVASAKWTTIQQVQNSDWGRESGPFRIQFY